VVGVGLGAGVCAMLVHSVLEYTLIGEPSLPIFALLGVAAALAADARARHARRLRERAARAAPKIQLVVALLLVPAVMLMVGAALATALT
jgi:hypothetical protein